MERLLTTAKAKTIINLLVLCAAVVFALPIGTHAATTLDELRAVLEVNYPDGLPRYTTPEELQWMAENPLPPAPAMPEGLEMQTAAWAPTVPIHTPAEYEPTYGPIIAWEGASAANQQVILTDFIVGITTDPNSNSLVFVGVANATQQAACTAQLVTHDPPADIDRVRFFYYNFDSIWVCDGGPRSIIQNGNTKAIIDHKYNRTRPLDDAFPAWCATNTGSTIPPYPLAEPLYNWGGNTDANSMIHGGGNFLNFTNGDGFSSRLIVDENPTRTEAQIIQSYHDYFDVNATLFPRLSTSVDATSHIDMWFFPLGDNKVLISQFSTNTYGEQTTTNDAAAAMAARGYTVYRTPAWYSGGTHYTYTNMAIINKKVFVPTYAHANDAGALATIASAMPGYTIVSLDCSATISLAGAIHCIIKHVYFPVNPYGEVLAPNGGETYSAGRQYQIKWIANGNLKITSVDLYYSTNNGSSWNTIATGETHDGYYTWTAPSVDSTQCLIRTVVHDSGGNTYTDNSNATFTLTTTPLVTFVSAGAVTSNAAAITPALPSGIAAGDILLLFLETSNQAITIPTPNGGTWTEVTNSPQSTGTAAGSTGARLTVFWSRYNGTQGAPTTSDSGDHQTGQILAFRGAVSSGNPWDVTAGGVEAVADTSGAIPGATTTVANTLVVAAIAAALPDADGWADFSAWTNANLTNVTERTDITSSQGNGGGLGIVTGGKSTASAYGNTTVTLATSSYKAMMTIALKPEAGATPPGPATNPTPSTGATNVSRTQDLSWTAGTGTVTSRDVYFGTVNPPVTKVLSDVTVLTYDTGTMNTSTTYYWRVDEKNTGGTTTGTVWNFTTVPPPPAPASSPVPSTGATNVSLTQDISWSAGSGATSRDVYFGTINPPVTKVIADGTALTYDTGTMATSKTYYWRVDEKNTGGTTTGTVWNFTTVPPPPAPASSPVPSTGATNVSLTQDISWAAGSGVATRDVYFGTVNPPVTKVIADGTALTYDTGTMATSKTYYWRVDEKNTGGTTTGTVWNFTTVPPPPAPASSPVPSTGATNVSLTQDLSWAAGSGVATRDVYFGTVNPPVTKVIADGTALTYDTGTMVNNKTYYWRVDEKNTGGTTTGTVWSFATNASVPNVVGSAQADANTAIIGAGLTVGTITTECSNTVAAGNVISQNPTGGTQVNVGSAVDLVVSSGQPSVPDVTGQAEATAIANINAVANISYGSSTTECSDTVAAGNVISQSATGTVTCGTVVNLVISSGQPSVPDVTGQAEATAIANINAVANISYGSSTTECSNTVAAGNVISQSVTGTTTCGTVVNLVISSGQPSVPDVTGQAEATAIANINAVANISYGSSTTECSNTVAAGNVISQSSVGAVDCGTVVNLVVSSGQPSVPDVTGQAEATAIANINAVANISYGSSTTECSDTVAAGNVISQSVTGITTCGTVVNLVISSGQPSVPDVTGQAEATAIANINAVANISYGSSTTECSDTVAAGNVISQSATGTVTCGTVVNLVISSGQPSVPDVTGQAEATAIANINAVANISYGSSTTECSDTVAAGNVISQSSVGAVDCGTVVNLVISSGQPSVPDVTGQAEATAIANINAVANISYGSSTTQCSDTVAAGLVISQSATGTVTCGTVVNLVISSGQPSVPDVTGQVEATAIANINAVANISYGSSTTQCSNTVAAGNVISQSVTGTTTCGTVVNLVISSGQPSVPDVTGQAEATAIANINAVANISYGSSTTQCSNTVAAGNVISQSVTGTTTCGTVVNLVISSGQPSVPDVTGQAEATAIANINAVANISYGSSTTECSDTVAAGNVISQSSVGAVDCGTVVNLVISSGQPSVPDVTGQAEATAIANINAVANISYGSSTTECSNTVAAGLVISQSATGTVTCGTVVNLVISSGQPSVPDVTGQAEATAIANINAVANISYGSSTTQCSDTVAAGLVISQSATGTVTCGTVVNLVISSGQPSVPDVTGQAQATAIANINAVANISYGSSTTQCSDTVAAGNVISQSATGTVTCGTVVNLVISSGQPTVPDVTGQAEATAIANINAVANISYGSSTTECSDTVAAGNVISQSVTGTVTCGTVVNLVISSGQPSVPDVTGQAEATAIANINAVANISYGSSTTECSNTVAAGNVISQSATGTVSCGTVVNLVISSGQPSVPDVTGQAEATAIANINAVANISYGSSTTECSNTVAAGNVISQSATGTVSCGTVVNLVISSGQPSVPDVTGQAEATAIANINAVANISYGSSTTECSNTVAAGNVISQSATGTVTCGTVVNLVISSGQPSVPDVTGQAEATAIANINAVANISYGSSTTQCSDTVAAGLVISQSATGTVTCGTVVNLVISSGQPSVPDVTGQVEATAIANINAVANISYGSSTTQCSNTVAAGNVISQSVTGTTTCGTVVNLVISSGQPSVPDVTGQAEATAIANINAVANISYGSSTTQCSNTVAAGNVISQSVTGTTTCGTVVNLVISSGQPSVPDVTGQAEATAIANINAVANISYGSSTTECSDTVAAGNVISQSSVGAVDCGTVVNLVISSGQPSVPDVTGQAEATAIANINAVANISYGSSTTECSNTVAAGLVISQSATGTVTCGTVVNLVISSGQPSVPDVTGQAEATAIANINAVANISYGSSTTQCSDTVAAGLVISQSATGTVTCGTVVNLVISSGQPSVPDVTGQAQATAIANINAVANISYGSSTTQCSDTVAAGNVISQSATGTVTCGTVVNLVISSGQPTVPDVTGQAEATAIANINAVANISYGSSTTECSDTVAAGNVISQSVTGTVTCGTVVNLVISSGQPSVPDVTGQAEATAIANINAVANISYGSSTTECSNTVAAGNVISQSATGTVSCGTVVNLVISSGQPSVPDVTGQAEATAIANINAVANISYGSSTTECSNTVAAGNVISQSATGTVSCGTVVNLVISSGQPSVPDVTGQAEATAIANINAVANISYGSSTTECSNTVAAGNVISQSATGTVTCGTVVNLVISSGQPSVPDVTGQAEATAIANINAVANISYGSSTTECSNTVAAGNVISQSATGTVTCGTVVNLVISSGQPSVPDVTGQAEAAAIANINAVANISYGSSTTECSNTVAAGNVISQSATGTVTCGTVVNLVISSGQPSVPDVTGQAEATAIANINAVANISYGSSTTQCSDTVAAGNVISQSATGTVTCGTVVNLVISSGQPSVPDVTGQAEATAIANINAVANISYGSSTTQYSETVPAGYVISQSATGAVDCGTVVDLVVSLGEQITSLAEDFNDNERSAMWRMTSYDPEGTRVSEYVARLNLLTALQSDLTANCVGHWKLNDNAANTTVLDSSGTGHNGTATRNTNLLAAAGKINGAFLFNGTSDSINVGNIIGTGAYTKVAWVKREVGATSYNIISGGYSGSNTGHAFWAPNYGSFLYSYKLSAGHNYIFNAVQDSVPLDVNVWRFVAVTYDPAVNSGRMVLYKDGVKVDDANNVPVPAGSGGVTYISNFVSGNYFKGSIDNAMIFNRALSEDEIATLYNDSNGTESLVEYTAGSNEFLANGWGIDANDNFEAKVDFHYSSTSSPASWVGMTIENDADNYISITAGANGSSPYFQYAKVVDGNVTSAETSRASNDGSLYISYDAALDKLYLSYSGYGASNAWQTITGLLGGQWLSKPLMISLGGGSDGSSVNNSQAYLDNFAASGSMFGWPPATDLDDSGFIDWADILVIAENWLATGSTPADIDGDGTVDFADFAELGLAW